MNKQVKEKKALKIFSYSLVKSDADNNYTFVDVLDLLKKVALYFKPAFLGVEKECIIENNINFMPLAPVLLNPDEEKIATNFSAFKTALNNPKIKNIAITGAYGSGKSSFLETFQWYNNNYKFLNISLASFSTYENTKDLEKLIELSILQQIFYHVKHNKIPDSRFVRIKNLKFENLFFSTLLLVIWLLSFLVVFKFKFTKDLLFPFQDMSLYVNYISFLIFFLGLFPIVYKVIRLVNNNKLNKFNVQSLQIELNSNEQSIFNKYLEEIIYFFEVTEYNVVIFEDIDRFEDVEGFDNKVIFTKLREINLIINKSEQIGRRITFVYALKDELFIDNARTKFFDFLLPIIPVINISNSSEKIIERIQELEIDKKPSKNTIEDISIYLGDMRLVNNIVNEFVVYSENLKLNHLEADKLFAMIVYKNVEPLDFAKLHDSKGEIYKQISNKEKYLVIEIDNYDKEIDKLKNRREKYLNDNLKSEKEIRELYIIALQKMFPEAKMIEINGITFSFVELLNDENFETLKHAEKIKYISYRNYNNNYFHLQVIDSKKKFKDIEQFVEHHLNYDERVGNLNNQILNEINKEIKTLEDKKSTIKSWSLKKVLNSIEFDEIELNLKNKRLIVFLLKNGLIDENYFDYISYFHGVSLTISDNTFLQNIKVGSKLDFNFKLNKIQNLVKKIQLRYYKNDSIFNFDLADYLFNENQESIKGKEAFLNQLTSGSALSLKFIIEYINREKNLDIFISGLVAKNKMLWKQIEQSEEVFDKILVLKKIFLFANQHDIKILSIWSKMKDYLSNEVEIYDFLKGQEITKFKNVILNLELDFSNLSKPSDENEKDVFNFIVDNSLYKLNENNVRVILEELHVNFTQEDFNEKNLTLIQQVDNENFKGYIQNFLDDYLKKVYFSLTDEVITEKQDVIIDLLNKDEVEYETKKDFCSRFEFKLYDTSLIDDESIKKLLFDNQRLEENWDNVYDYYSSLNETKDVEEKVLNGTLVNYLNDENVYKKLSLLKIDDHVIEDESERNKFNRLLVEEYDLDDKSYCFLLDSITRIYYRNIDLEYHSEEKSECLIKKKKLKLTVDNYDELKKNYHDLHIKFIKENFSDFLELEESLDIDAADLNLIFKLNTFKDNELLSILEYIDKDIIVTNKDNCNNVCDLMLKKLKKIEFTSLILAGIISKIDTTERKVKFLNLYIERLSIDEIKTVFKSLPLQYKKFLNLRSRTEVVNETYNLFLIDVLKRKGLISSSSNDIDKRKVKVIGVFPTKK